MGFVRRGICRGDEAVGVARSRSVIWPDGMEAEAEAWSVGFCSSRVVRLFSVRWGGHAWGSIGVARCAICPRKSGGPHLRGNPDLRWVADCYMYEVSYMYVELITTEQAAENRDAILLRST